MESNRVARSTAEQRIVDLALLRIDWGLSPLGAGFDRRVPLIGRGSLLEGNRCRNQQSEECDDKEGIHNAQKVPVPWKIWRRGSLTLRMGHLGASTLLIEEQQMCHPMQTISIRVSSSNH